MKLYLVTDRKVAGGRELKWIVKEAVRGGVTMVLSGDVNFSFTTAARLAHALKMDFFPELREKAK